MEQELSVTGIILDDGPVGDYDKRVSILTMERGRISAFLRGAKRSGRSRLSFLGPFCYGTFYLYEGRSSYTVKKVDIQNRFEGVRNDLLALAYGSYFLDVARYYSRENTDEAERVKLLYVALLSLEKAVLNPDLVRLIYELKNICLQGEYPNVFECASCKSREELEVFSMQSRSIFCKNCSGSIENGIKLSTPVVHTLIYIFMTPVEKVFSFKLSDKAFESLRDFLDKYILRYYPHKFKTLEYLDSLNVDNLDFL